MVNRSCERRVTSREVKLVTAKISPIPVDADLKSNITDVRYRARSKTANERPEMIILFLVFIVIALTGIQVYQFS